MSKEPYCPACGFKMMYLFDNTNGSVYHCLACGGDEVVAKKEKK